jgi:hypothetical protein
MSAELRKSRRASHPEEIAPLIELCKAGRLFEVQEWLAAGKPIDLPSSPKKGNRARSPLEVAIERGFHSLVQVLLEGGALHESVGYDCPMNRALRARRFDLVQLFVEHGFDPKSVDMREVFATWDPQIMAYFIQRGADLRRENPFAHAFCDKIRTTLRPFKECRQSMPDLQEQANIALRYHCKEGNFKWVSLMLWAGADPWKPGPAYPNEELGTDYEGMSALEHAAISRHFEIFELKQIRSRLAEPVAATLISYLTRAEGLTVLNRILEKGVDPNDQKNGGCSALRSCLAQMSWGRIFGAYSWERDGDGRNLDTSDARDRLKAIHLLVRHGAKWIPEGKDEINSARRSLRYLKVDYTVEFVWIMSKYKACTLDCIQNLLRTSTMKSHIATHRARLQELLTTWG